jgi:hypothetical protein
MWISFVHDQNPNNHGIGSFNGTSVPTWPLYAGTTSIQNASQAAADVLEGYGVNLRFDQQTPGLANLQPDTYSAEAIAWLNANSVNVFAS